MAGDAYIVYKHTSPDGKVYIGITGRKAYQRWHNGHGYKQHRYFWNAIQKYGWGNIRHEVLFEGLTKEEAERKEVELIAEYKSNQREFGYNLSTGGESGSKGATFGEETRKKMRAAHTGKKMSEVAKIRMSLSARGKRKSPDAKEKYKMYQVLHNGKRVHQLSKDGLIINEFETIQEAERRTGVDNSHIRAVCKGRRKTAGGFLWKFAEVSAV